MDTISLKNITLDKLIELLPKDVLDDLVKKYREKSYPCVITMYRNIPKDDRELLMTTIWDNLPDLLLFDYYKEKCRENAKHASVKYILNIDESKILLDLIADKLPEYKDYFIIEDVRKKSIITVLEGDWNDYSEHRLVYTISNDDGCKAMDVWNGGLFQEGDGYLDDASCGLNFGPGRDSEISIAIQKFE